MGVIEEAIRYDTAQAESALKALAGQVSAAQEKTEALQNAGKQAGGSLKGLEDGAGAAGSALGRLGGAADLISPGLGNLVRTGADLADVFEVVGVAGSAAGVGLGPLLAILGPIAAVGAAAYLVLNDMSEGVERLRERAAAAAPALEAMRQGLKNVAAAEGDLAIQRGEVDGTMDVAQLELARARKQAASTFATQRGGAGELLEQASSQRSDALTALRAAEEAQAQAEANVARLARSGPRNDAGGGESAGLERARMDAAAAAERTAAQAAALADADASVTQARSNLEELGKAEEDLAFRIAQTNLAKQAQAEAARNVANATQAEGKVVDGAASALEARADAIRRATAQYMEAQNPLLAYQRILEEIANLEQRGVLSGPEAADARAAAAAKAADQARAAGNAEQARLSAEAAAEAGQKAQDAERAQAEAEAAAAARAEQRLAITRGVAGATTSLMGGDAVGALSGALGMLGPYGAVAGGALSGLSTLGEQGADQIASSIQSGLESLLGGLTELPALLEQLPDLLAEMAPELAGALVEAGPELAVALVGAQAELLLQLPSLLGEAVYEAMARAWQEAKEFFAAPFSGGNTLGQRAQNAAVDAARVIAGVTTFGASEIAYGAVNRATDGRAQEALYAGSRERSSSRARDAQNRSADRAAYRNTLSRAVGVDRDVVSVGLTRAVEGGDDLAPTRIRAFHLRS